MIPDALKASVAAAALFAPSTAACNTTNETKLGVKVLTDGSGDLTSWNLVRHSDGPFDGRYTSSEGPYTPNKLYSKELCADRNAEYAFAIMDNGGDGLCCASGEGYYAIELDDVEIARGGEFGNSETWSFPAKLCPDATLQVQVMTDYFGTQTTWTLTRGDGSSVTEIDLIGGRYGSYALNSHVFCEDTPQQYEFVINHGAGDSMQGYYAITLDGVEVASGGNFTDTETKTFVSHEECSATPPAAVPIPLGCASGPTPAQTTVTKGPTFGVGGWHLNQSCYSSNFALNATDEFTLGYLASPGRRFDFRWFNDLNCTNEVTNDKWMRNSTKAVHTPIGPYEDIRVSIDLEKEGVATSPLWDNETGSFQFCVQAQLGYCDGDNFEAIQEIEESYQVKVDLAADFDSTFNLTAAKRGEVSDQVSVSDFVELCKCNSTLHCNADSLKQGEELHICAKPLNITRVAIDKFTKVNLEFANNIIAKIIDEQGGVVNSQITALTYEEAGMNAGVRALSTILPVKYYNSSNVTVSGSVQLKFASNETDSGGRRLAGSDEVPDAASFRLIVALADDGVAGPEPRVAENAAAGGAGAGGLLCAAAVAAAAFW